MFFSILNHKPRQCFRCPESVGYCRNRSLFLCIPPVSKRDYTGTDQKETQNMEAVFPMEFFSPGNDLFPIASRYRLAKETSPYPIGNPSELPCIEPERTRDTTVSRTELTLSIYSIFASDFSSKNPRSEQ